MARPLDAAAEWRWRTIVMRIAFYLTIFAVLTGGANPVHAAGAKDQARDKAAKKACLTGDFHKGAEILADLYLETNDPTYLFNHARCLELNHRCADANDRFIEYMRKSPHLSQDEKLDVEKHIADCKGQISGETVPQHAPAALIAPTPAPMVQAPAVQPTVDLAASASPSPVASGGSGLRTAGIVTGAAGVVALGVGVFCNLKVNSLSDELNTLRQNGGWNQSKESSRNSYVTLGWIGYGVGAAALVTGTTLYILGASKKTESTATVAIGPVLLPGVAALSLQGTY
jgi:hypothetical protein